MTQRNTVHNNLDVIVMTTSQHTSDNDAFVLLKNLTRFRVVFKTNFRKSSYAKAHLLFQKVLLKISFCKLRLQSFFQKESPHESLVQIVGGESEPQKEPRAVVPSSSLKCPPTGPPVEWLRRHGYMTKGRCNACDGLRSSGTRKAKTHSRACCKRYEEWLTTHASEHAGHDALPDEPMPHVALDPNSSDVLGNEPKVHFKEPPEWPDEAPRKRQSKGPDPRDEYYRSKEGDVGSFEDMEREFGVPGKTSTGPRIEDYEDMEVESFTPSTGIKDVTDDRDEIDDVANLGDVEDIVPDSVKRSPEISVEDLEKELDEERRVERRKLDALWGSPFVNLCQLCSEEPRVRLDDEYIESA